MKKALILLFTLFSFIGCQYDDLWIKDEFASLDERIKKLEKLCENMNSNISALNDIVAALESSEFITDITPIMENKAVIGYKIVFESGREISIYYGADGKDGMDGSDGAQGNDGHTPIVGVTQDEDGEWYWTIDGEWMLDNDGNRISTTGRQDLIPVLKIENMYWYISYDGGTTWEKLNKAVGENGESYFSDVTYDEENVSLTLSDGTMITIPMASNFELVLSVTNGIPCAPFQTLTIPYQLNGGNSESTVITLAEGDWRAEVIKESSTAGSIIITAPEDITTGKVAVIASNQKKTIVKSLSFEKGIFTADDMFHLSDQGGTFSVDVSTNYTYEISVDVSWISYVETKAVRDEEVVFSYEALPSDLNTRTATITFADNSGTPIHTIEITQGSLVSLEYSSLMLMLDEEVELVATNLTTQDLIWTSSDSNVVWVNQDGKIIAISKGTAVIKVMSSDYQYSASCTVTVADISDYVYLQYGSATNTSYSDGYLHYGSKLSWYMYNKTQESVYVKYVQLVDYAGSEGNRMSVEETIEANGYTGWIITIGSSIKGPKLKAVYEYKGKEYSCICGHMFN